MFKLFFQIDAQESLATSEVLLANLSEESNVSGDHQRPSGALEPQVTNSWPPLRQYSPRGAPAGSTKHSIATDDVLHDTPMDLRQSPSRRDCELSPCRSYHSSHIHQSPGTAPNLYPCTAESGTLAVAESLIFRSSQGFPMDTNPPISSGDISNMHSTMGSPLINSEGVVLNLDSCTVLPQTLNFSHLFSPTASAGLGCDAGQSVVNLDNTVLNPGTNGIYVATSEIMRNFSSYLSPPNNRDNTAVDCAVSHPEYITPSAEISAFDASFSMAGDFNLSYDDAVLGSISPRKLTSSAKLQVDSHYFTENAFFCTLINMNNMYGRRK